jgi:hypothetical protein
VGEGSEMGIENNMVQGGIEGPTERTGGLAGVLTSGHAFSNLVNAEVLGDALFAVPTNIQGNNFFIVDPSGIERFNQSSLSAGAVFLKEALEFQYDRPQSKLKFNFMTDWKQREGSLPQIRYESMNVADINQDRRVNFFDIAEALELYHSQIQVTPRSFGNFDHQSTVVETSDLAQLVAAMNSAP